jgi:glc operon protein GlcG
MPILQTHPVLVLADVDLIARAAREEAERNDWKVAIVVVVDGGHPLLLQRLNVCAPVAGKRRAARRSAAAIPRAMRI